MRFFSCIFAFLLIISSSFSNAQSNGVQTWTESDGQVLREIESDLWIEVWSSYSGLARGTALVAICGDRELEMQLQPLHQAALRYLNVLTEATLREHEDFQSLDEGLLVTKSRDLAWSLFMDLNAFRTGYREGLNMALQMDNGIVDVDYLKDVYCIVGRELANRLLTPQ